MDALKSDALQRLVACTAHALNNAQGILYSVEDHLDDAPSEDEAVIRARRALRAASGSIQGICDALAVLGISAGDFPGGESRPPFELRATDFGGIAESLRATADIRATPSPDIASVRTFVDRETLRALLDCMATVLRRAAGRATGIHGGWSAVPDPRDARSIELTYQFRAEFPGPESVRVLGQSTHPCELALTHAAEILPGHAATLDLSGGTIRLIVRGQASC